MIDIRIDFGNYGETRSFGTLKELQGYIEEKIKQENAVTENGNSDSVPRNES